MFCLTMVIIIENFLIVNTNFRKFSNFMEVVMVITIAKLEKDLILGNGSVSKWNSSSPKADTLYNVEEYFGVTMEYLLTGKEKPTETIGGSAEDMELIQKLSDVSPEIRQSILNLLTSLELSSSPPGGDSKEP